RTAKLCHLCPLRPPATAPNHVRRETDPNMTATKRHIKHKSFSSIVLCLLCLFVADSFGQAPSVTKVDPPSWWAKHTINPVRLLVHGANLRGAHVKAMNSEMRVSGVSVNERGTYLFMDVEISPSLDPGKYPLVV